MKMKRQFFRVIHSLFSFSLVLLLSSCATTKNNMDPYEGYNRVAFNFNRGVDLVIFRPVADLYDTLTPAPIQGGIGRMITNFYEPGRVINDILQGQFLFACHDGTRFILNSTLGLAGFFDVAEKVGYPVSQQDFGITMARWGWNRSAYFVMPFLGIYTVRDLVAAPFDGYAFTFWPYMNESLGWKLFALEKIHVRSTLRPADKLIDEALDPYVFVRDAYLQKRKKDIDFQFSGRNPEVKPSAALVDEEKPKSASPQKTESVGPAKTKSLPDIIS